MFKHLHFLNSVLYDCTVLKVHNSCPIQAKSEYYFCSLIFASFFTIFYLTLEFGDFSSIHVSLVYFLVPGRSESCTTGYQWYDYWNNGRCYNHFPCHSHCTGYHYGRRKYSIHSTYRQSTRPECQYSSICFFVQQQ